MPSRIRNIAIVGGSGQIGSVIVDNLLKADRFEITAITRPDSKSKFPDAIKVKKGEYDDLDFLQKALTGQEALIVALGISAPEQIQKDFITAASKAEVPYILTNYWSSDGSNKELYDAMPLLQEKGQFHTQIEDLGKSGWLAIANNQWIDFNLREGYFGIDIPKREAVLFDEGTTKIFTTTTAQVGRAVAALFSLPSLQLASYKNRFTYIRSFELSQRDMLDAIQRATNTTDKDWKITKKPVDKHIEEGKKADKDDKEEKMKLVFGPTFKEGLGDRFYGKDLDNEKLGLPQENLDDVIKDIVKQSEEKVKKEKEEKEKKEKEEKK